MYGAQGYGMGDMGYVGPGGGKRMAPDGGPHSSGGQDPRDGDEHSAQALKRPRLVWTPQLHKRFEDAVNRLGLKNAVPKTIMQVRF